nr:hypothetical protein [Tanacetum cinerariifolium]GEW36854.1 hypothetical protein [Tanacetum cinerariifolium]
MFIKYSTNQIPPKKSRGKGSKGKKSTKESQETINVSEESAPKHKPAKKNTSSKRRVKKKVTLSTDDNIISDDPDAALKLPKSISQTELQEAEATRKVHVTHARIVTEYIPEYAKKKSSSRISKSVVIQDTPSTLMSKRTTLKVLHLLLHKNKKLQTSCKLLRKVKRQAEDNQGVEQNSEFSGVDNDDVEKDDKDSDADDEGDDHVSDTQDAEYEDDSADADVSSLLDIPIQHVTPQIESPSVQKIPVSVIPETTNLSPIPEFVTKTMVTTADPSPQVAAIILTVQQTTTPIPTPTITTYAPTVTTIVHVSNALTVVELRVAKLEKDVSELKTVDHSSKALVVLQSYVPTVVDSYLIPKLEIKSANHQLYHALMETFIEDENAMDKGLADTVKDQKIKHDDDEDPLTGPNKGKKTKRRRTKESEFSKKPSTTKETPKGKAPTKGSKTGKSASTKEPVEEPIAEVIMDDAGDDVANDDNPPQDTSEPKTRKTLNPYWFKQPLRPPTPNPEWNKCHVVLDQPTQPWFNQMVSASKDPLTFNDLMATFIDFSKYILNGLKIKNLTRDILLGPAFNLLKGTCFSKGDHYPFDISKPLPLQGPPSHRTVAADYFFNNDLEYLKTSDLEVTYTTSIMKTKVVWYKIKGTEDMVPTLWSTIKHAYDKDALMGIKHWGERRKLWYRSQVRKFSKKNVYSTKAILDVKSVSVKKLHRYGHLEEIVVKRSDQRLYKFKEGDFVDLHLNNIKDMLLLAV